jgi:serine/threonine-protein kinase HipA
MADALLIWLGGLPVARVHRTRNGRIRLTYTSQALAAHELGTPLLSNALRVTAAPFSNDAVSAFLEGLLPEGDVLLAVAAEFDLRASDTFALVSYLGRDCAGALIIQPEGAPQPAPPTVHTSEPVSEADLARLIDNLRTAPLGIDQRVRISLGGAQDKLLLTQRMDGTWGLPVDGTPSTHILKPQIRGYPNTVENEAFCMRMAAHAALQVADITTLSVEERPVLVVRRYDRVIHGDGSVTRVHQEDLCQALGLHPLQKYEENAGASLRRIARILDTFSPPEDLENLLRYVTFNAVLGNGDAHAKNYSLVHVAPRTLRLAPLYDVLCTSFYEQHRLALYIDSVQRTDRVTRTRIINEAVSWGVAPERASEIVDDLLQRIPDALDRAGEETPNVPGALLTCVRRHFEQITSG